MKTENSRIDVADVLRGFAVMGIILLHSIEHFNFYAFPDTVLSSICGRKRPGSGAKPDRVAMMPGYYRTRTEIP